jgi:deoxyribodipyrimidine photolyase-related protein
MPRRKTLPTSSSSSTSPFRRALADRQTDPAHRRWIFVPYDQLSDAIGPLSREDPRELGIVLVENPGKARRRPYHRQKIALIIANLRHFALEQAARGIAVHHVVANTGSYALALQDAAAKLGPLRMMRPAERELRVELQPIIDRQIIDVLPHEGWLTTTDQFHRSISRGTPIWRMDSFYRLVRQETDILMKNDKPLGGKFSFDHDNRQPWKGRPPAPAPLHFPDDIIKTEVALMIEKHFADHPGKLDLAMLPATQADAQSLWLWAKQHALPIFGPFEDAMSSSSRSLFHTRLSSLLNIGRLLPKQLVEDAAQLDIDLASKEGFIRQILGWREFVRHVHDQTDGFRTNILDETSPATWPIQPAPGSGGYAAWTGKPWTSSADSSIDGGANPNFLHANQPIPPAYWGTASGLACLDQVVSDVWEEAYSHHITRLMILANIASLLDVSPRELTDWFWVAYIDAFDWVVEPNVLAMGTFAVGPVMTTKPYIAGSAYIDRMSDYCKNCAFDPKTNCPLASLYWAYLERHRTSLQNNPRLSLPLATAAKRTPEQKQKDQETFRITTHGLQRGQRLSPASFVAIDSLTQTSSRPPSRPKKKG